MNTISLVNSVTNPNSTLGLSIPKSFTYNEYDYYVFTSGISSFLCKTPADIDFIIVGGGGAGGGNHAGGGGAGGVAYGSSYLYSGETYTITIGDGGVGGISTVYNSINNNGGSSSIVGQGLNITAYGGGYGGGQLSGYPYNISNLIFHLPFDTNFKEVVSNQTLGGLYNSPTIDTTVQRIGTGCLDCHLGGYIGTNINYTFLSTFTLSCWIKFTVLPTASTYHCYFLFAPSSGYFYLNNINSSGPTSSIQFWAGGYQTVIDSPVLNTWYNIVLTTDSTNKWSGYVNGVSVFSNVSMNSPSGSGSIVQLGGALQGAGTPQQSYIYLDDFRIYGYVFSNSQIQSLYNGVTDFSILVASGGGGTGYGFPILTGGLGGEGVSDLSYGSVGYTGGSGFNNPGNGGGGGGAGGLGVNASATLGGNGGIGVAITWLSNVNATGYMSNISSTWGTDTSNGTYIAGGGGGGSWAQNGWQPGTGGLGGGATGGKNGTGSGLQGGNGTDYTGGGGGGGASTGNLGGSGGCGLVVIRSLSSYSPYLYNIQNALNIDPYLFLYYTFNTSDYSGNIIYNKAPDSTINGTLINGASISSNYSVVGDSSLYLNAGLSQYVKIDSFRTGTNGLTFAFWFKSNSSGTNAKLFDFGKGSANENIMFTVNNGGNSTAGIQVLNSNKYQSYNGNAYFYPILNNINCNSNTWNHFTITYTVASFNSPTSLGKIYVNGALNGVFTSSFYPGNNIRSNNFIGKSNSILDPYFNGYIDDFRMYNRVLISGEIKLLQNMNVNSRYYMIDQLSQATQSTILYNGTSLSAGMYGLNLLYSEYTDPILTIRKSSDLSSNYLQNIYADVNGRLGTSYLGNGIPIVTWLNGDIPYVVQWWDQTGNGNHATQTENIDYQPILDIVNNKLIFINGTYFNLPNGSYPYGDSEYTYTFKSAIANNGSVFGGGVQGTSTMNSFSKF